jgi:ABC-type antimicrobial peptide transport system permease subunit
VRHDNCEVAEQRPNGHRQRIQRDKERVQRRVFCDLGNSRARHHLQCSFYHRTVLGGIAATSLIVAGIGIMNTIIVSLMERTREIEILKTMETKSRTALLIFISDAVIIGVFGGAIGIGLGWVLANVVAVVFRAGGALMGNQASGTSGLTTTPVLTPTVFLGAIAFGIGISAIFALYPAWQASKPKHVTPYNTNETAHSKELQI